MHHSMHTATIPNESASPTFGKGGAQATEGSPGSIPNDDTRSLSKNRTRGSATIPRVDAPHGAGYMGQGGGPLMARSGFYRRIPEHGDPRLSRSRLGRHFFSRSPERSAQLPERHAGGTVQRRQSHETEHVAGHRRRGGSRLRNRLCAGTGTVAVSVRDHA